MEQKEELSPTEKALAEVRAKRAALAEKTKARDAERAPMDALEAESRALADEEAIDEAERVHGRIKDGRIAAVRTRMGVVIVKRPEAIFYKRFMDGKSPRADAEALVNHCLVHPTQEKFDALILDLPATIDVVTAACTQLAGITAQEVTGK
jgi:pyruvate/2-oxoglutarate dehydrogenase complex dihydrolipoamide acyltransferase (E2) component